MMDKEQLFEKVRGDIQEDGWSTISVFPTLTDPGVHFSYSIGFREHGRHPEVIILGIPSEYAHPMIRTLYERVAAGERFEDGQRLDGVLEEYQVELRAVPPDGAPLNMARAFYDVEELAALQIVWPDKEGLFPGEEGCDEGVALMQNLEGLRAEDEARNADDNQMRTWVQGLPRVVPPISPPAGLDYSLPAHEGEITDGEDLLNLFRGWSNADNLDLDRFWQDFEVDAQAIREFAQHCGMALNTSPPVVGMILTFGAALAKARYKPKGQPEFTI